MLSFVLLCLVPAALADYYKFTKAAPVTLVAAFGGNERYLVKMPCKGAWFKLFLSGKETVGHIEIYGRTKGNIFCKGAGNKRWYNGEKTDFTMNDSGLKCEDDGYVHYRIKKDSNSISIMNYGKVLYTQNFDSSDGNCKTQETSVIKTQVFPSDAVLYVGIVEMTFTEAPLFTAFTKSGKITKVAVFGDNEGYMVKVPCAGAWFKLFLKDSKGSNAHIEIYSWKKGNLYCKNGGSKNWYSGQKTDFAITKTPVCKDGFVLLRINKNSGGIQIKNDGEVLFQKSFGSTDGNCRYKTEAVTTQVFPDRKKLYLAIDDKFTGEFYDWNKFSKTLKLDKKLSLGDVEHYFVKGPCRNVWFKLFLTSGHVEIYSNKKGNLFCKKGGSKNWYGGQKTDFNFKNSVKCENDSYIYEVQKSKAGIKILNSGIELFSKTFGGTDGDCRLASSFVKTQVFTSDSELYLAIA